MTDKSNEQDEYKLKPSRIYIKQPDQIEIIPKLSTIEGDCTPLKLADILAKREKEIQMHAKLYEEYRRQKAIQEELDIQKKYQQQKDNHLFENLQGEFSVIWDKTTHLQTIIGDQEFPEIIPDFIQEDKDTNFLNKKKKRSQSRKNKKK